LVRCEDLTGEAGQQHALEVRAWQGEWDEDGGVRSHLSSEDDSLLVYGRGERELFSRTGFERWYSDYDTTNPVGFAFRNPSPEEHAQGARYVMIADWIERDPAKLPFSLEPFRR
jgi:hypothetical protein